jgi:hypothetical protein
VKYLFLGLLIYWIVKRIFRIKDVVQQKGPQPNNTTIKNPKKSIKQDDKHGGEYVDYEEVD